MLLLKHVGIELKPIMNGSIRMMLTTWIHILGHIHQPPLLRKDPHDLICCNSLTYMDGCSLDALEDGHEPTIIAALSFLPILLSKSDYSGTLVKLIENHSFRDECKDLPELAGAKLAMSNYRERMQRDERFQRTRRLRKSHARSL